VSVVFAGGDIEVSSSVGLRPRIGVVDVEHVVEVSRARMAIDVKREREEREKLEALERELYQIERRDWIEGMPGPRRRRWTRSYLSFPARTRPDDPVLRQMRDEVRALINTLGAERAYDLILDRRAVVVIGDAEHHDLTDEVLRLYDRQVNRTSLFQSTPMQPQGD
jgi:hypothetical protein